jgi:hypothetical protein
MLSLMLIFSGCGKDVAEQPEPVVEDEQDDTVKYQLILDYGFESKKTSYAEGDKVKVYYNIIATDTDYSFYTDSEDVELKRDYDDKKGFVISFIMPAHDVALHVDSVNSMEYHPQTFNDVPDEAMNEFFDYVDNKSGFSGAMPVNICMFDMTEDGYEDICGTFYTDSYVVIVYDPAERHGYALDGGKYYDFMIDGIEDGLLLVTRTDLSYEEEDVTGALVLSHDWLVIIEDTEALKMGLSYKTICMFGLCAKELLPGDTSGGDYLSSMDFYNVRVMLFSVSCIFYETEMYEEHVSYEPDSEPEAVPVYLVKMPYDEWKYLVEEVFMEEDAENLLANLDDSYHGEYSVYYNPDDDCIYLEMGMIGDVVEWEITDVSKEGHRYVLTYDVLAPDGLLWTADVTIEESDNTYGYRLISIEITDAY